MNATNVRQRVMHYAHNLYTTAAETNWSECLRKAWKLVKLIIRMYAGAVHFVYKKVDGSFRSATGTLRISDLSLSHGSRQKKSTYDTICYFDLDKWQFRSFRIANLISA